MSLGAGARRTDTAYPRFVHAVRAADVMLYISGNGRQNPTSLAALPEVADWAVATALQPADVDFIPVVLTDSRLGTDINRFKLLSGRLPRTSTEVMVGFTLASSRHLRLGSPLVLPMPSPNGDDTTAPSRVTLRVVGIEAAPGEFPPLPYSTGQSVYLARSFLGAPAGRSMSLAGSSIVEMAVHLRGGLAAEPRFRADLERTTGAPVGLTVLADQAVDVERTMRFQGLALWLTAAFGGLVAALIFLQLLVRQLGDDVGDHIALRSLGMSSGGLAATAMLRVAVVVAGSVLGALLTSWLISPVFPLGTARTAEPTPGLRFDWIALGAGAAILGLSIGLTGALAAWRTVSASRSRAGEGSPSQLSFFGRIRLASLPLPAATGIRFALRPGRGRRTVPVRATVVATAVGLAAAVAAATFASSLGHLLSTPHLYGVNFDADVELNGNFSDVRPLIPAIGADPSVAAVAVAETGIPLTSGRTHFAALATTNVEGAVDPTIVAGRLPAAPGETALGSRTMSDLHTAIGRTVRVAVEGLTRPLSLRVVGRAVLATTTPSETLGRGAVLAPGGIAEFKALAPPGFDVPPPGDVFVRFRPGVERSRAIAELVSRLGGSSKVLVFAPTLSTDLVDFGQVRDLPQVLAGLLSLLAVATMAYLLITAIRRRRPDLAVLKTLGFVPLQISAVIAWQATTVVVVGLAVGIPVGVAAGRGLWAAIAGQTGVVVESSVPLFLFLGLVPAALLVANLVALGPALAAARISPARVLRSE